MLSNIVNKLVSFNNPNIDCQLNYAQKISQVPAKRRAIILDILELYQCRPKNHYFDHYCEDAIFEDPIVSAFNREEIRSQFVMMPQVLSRSKTLKFNILRIDTHEVVIDLYQWYETFGLRMPVPVRSLVRLVFDSNDKVVYHGDYWYHSAAFDSMRGIVGFTWKQLRRLNGATMPYVASLIVAPAERKSIASHGSGS
ncbi:hypothetical protein DSO57_1004150 [Entomophthora muscae]|uniref:Uncharacterized protein n=1 Tax=Entomophthora muscae TaxID=34485 RepID=A0ACC2UI47_9FUNG|nr:hypothetical protein DSO57_1004150 [Entomophthora muscae]